MKCRRTKTTMIMMHCLAVEGTVPIIAQLQYSIGITIVYLSGHQLVSKLRSSEQRIIELADL